MIKLTDLQNLITDQDVLQCVEELQVTEDGYIEHPLNERLGPDDNHQWPEYAQDGLTLRKAINHACGGETQGEAWIASHKVD